MKFYPLPDSMQNILKRARQIGVCVDFAFFKADLNLSNEEIHRQAALSGMEEFGKRADSFRENIKIVMFGEQSKDKTLTSKDFAQAHELGLIKDWPLGVNSLSFSLEMNTADMHSSQLDLKDFIHIGQNEYFTDSEGNEIEEIKGVFNYAFLHPPYGFGEDRPEAEALFRTVVNFLTQDIIEIRQWSDDWSNYFEQGKDWWGAYFWTIYCPSQGWIAAIGASTTD